MISFTMLCYFPHAFVLRILFFIIYLTRTVVVITDDLRHPRSGLGHESLLLCYKIYDDDIVVITSLQELKYYRYDASDRFVT